MTDGESASHRSERNIFQPHLEIDTKRDLWTAVGHIPGKTTGAVIGLEIPVTQRTIEAPRDLKLAAAIELIGDVRGGTKATHVAFRHQR